jgi:hypothetical protein
MNISERRRYFEEFKLKNKNVIAEIAYSICDVACPCCGFPTQTEKRSFEICPLCDWHDDGQDDSDADTIRGGANSDYSLSEARRNFDKYLTMYRPGDKRFYESVAKLNFKGDIITDKLEIKMNIISKFYELYRQTDQHIIKKMFLEINSLLWSAGLC